MEQNTFHIIGMTCANCEYKIEKKLKQTKGISMVKVSLAKSTALVEFNPDTITAKKIKEQIESLGYEVNDMPKQPQIIKIIGAVIIIFALYMGFNHFGLSGVFNIFPTAEISMGYGMLFIIGLLTSVHCIAMCGGINLSQCIPNAGQNKVNLRPSFLYNLGRMISYTAVGGIVGAIGSVISFSGGAKGIMQLIAGIFMVIMGLNMLGLFTTLSRFLPKIPKVFVRKINMEKQSNSPLYVGLLNGLMPCGPLQAMQLYALSTGNPLQGALSMMLFSLGTVPLMLGLGALSSFLSRKFTTKMMMAGAVLVIFLGITMFGQGMSLSGISSLMYTSDNAVDADINGDVQLVTTALSSRSYEPITVKVGIPVRWNITALAKNINGCNNEIYIPEWGITKKFEAGDNYIEFTPTETGTFPYSCWMGMIRSSITVTE